MKISDLAAALNMKIVCPGGGREVTSGYTSDLLSDVMANAADGCALITIQAHVNTVAVSALTGVAAVIVCNNIAIPGDMAAAAEREGIAVLQTEYDQFKTSHLVYCEIAGGTVAG
jgi:predicted transcriptional regulator